ncbi:capsular biosynthesis protein, partial [Campylobacter jejuni]|nr:capsular biosynthesis protein [Campylobacter jejuni]EGN8954698.1 capsular biosynthesis protein [Campylobacter jejuni]
MNNFVLYSLYFIYSAFFLNKHRRIIKGKILHQKEHENIANYLENAYIKKYFENKLDDIQIKKTRNINGKKIIWQFWYQGIDNAPCIIKKCFKSVQKYKGNYEVVLLDKDNIKDYLIFPDFIYQKIDDKKFGEKTITIFSDLLRVSLLNNYGGIWLDAGMFLSGEIQKEILDQDFFIFHRSTKKPQDYKNWINFNYNFFSWDEKFKVNIVNGFILSNKNNEIMKIMQDILINYWKYENKLVYYFMFQILFDALKKKYLNLNLYITND